MSVPIELAKKVIDELIIATGSTDYTQIEVNDAIEYAKGYHRALVDNSLITTEESEELRKHIKSIIPKGKYLVNFHGTDKKLVTIVGGETFSFSKENLAVKP